MARFVVLLLTLLCAGRADACSLTAPSSAKAGAFFDMSWNADSPSGTITRADNTVVASPRSASGTASIWATNVLGPHVFTLNAGPESCEVTVSFTFTPPKGVAGYDIVILAGQSNSEGFGFGHYTPPSAELLARMVYQFGRVGGSDRKVVPVGYRQGGHYSDGLQSWEKAENDLSMASGLNFAQPYAAHDLQPSRKVLIVAVGHNGTSIRQWLGQQAQPDNVIGTTLIDDAVSRVSDALALPGDNRVVALIWQQGEADIFGSILGDPLMNADIYQQDEIALFNIFRQSIPGAYPYLVNQPVQTWLIDDPDKLAIKKQFLHAMNRAAAASLNAMVVTSADLLSNGDIGAYGGDMHFSADAQTRYGRRDYDAFERLLQN